MIFEVQSNLLVCKAKILNGEYLTGLLSVVSSALKTGERPTIRLSMYSNQEDSRKEVVL